MRHCGGGSATLFCPPGGEPCLPLALLALRLAPRRDRGSCSAAVQPGGAGGPSLRQAVHHTLAYGFGTAAFASAILFIVTTLRRAIRNGARRNICCAIINCVAQPLLAMLEMYTKVCRCSEAACGHTCALATLCVCILHQRNGPPPASCRKDQQQGSLFGAPRRVCSLSRLRRHGAVLCALQFASIAAAIRGSAFIPAAKEMLAAFKRCFLQVGRSAGRGDMQHSTLSQAGHSDDGGRAPRRQVLAFQAVPCATFPPVEVSAHGSVLCLRRDSFYLRRPRACGGCLTLSPASPSPAWRWPGARCPSSSRAPPRTSGAPRSSSPW